MEKDGSANTFSETGLDIVRGKIYNDNGDMQFPDTNAEKAFHIIKQRTLQLLESGEPVISLGGDHSISYPLIDAFTEKYNNLHILHFDAHGDLYENFDNNPYSHASPFARLLEKGRIASLTQVGIRTLNTHQQEQAKKYGVQITEMRHFNFDFLASLQSPLYITLDLDVLDPAFAPGVSHHEPGGLSVRDVLHAIQNVQAKIVGADIVEYNPIRDVHNMTAMVAYKMMKELIALMSE